MKTVCPKCEGRKDYRAKHCKMCIERPKHKKETRDKMSKTWRRKYDEEDYVNNMKGATQSEESIQKRLESKGFIASRNPDCPKWCRTKGAAWVRAIKKQWGNKCAKCGSEERLHAHHIMFKSTFPEYQYELWNGICLCHSCHWQVHKDLKEVSHSDI